MVCPGVKYSLRPIEMRGRKMNPILVAYDSLSERAGTGSASGRQGQYRFKETIDDLGTTGGHPMG